jgi:hypothetical protein
MNAKPVKRANRLLRDNLLLRKLHWINLANALGCMMGCLLALMPVFLGRMAGSGILYLVYSLVFLWALGDLAGFLIARRNKDGWLWLSYWQWVVVAVIALCIVYSEVTLPGVVANYISRLQDPMEQIVAQRNLPKLMNALRWKLFVEGLGFTAYFGLCSLLYRVRYKNDPNFHF